MPKVIERAQIAYETTIVLSEKESQALAKVLEWGAEKAVDNMLDICSEREVAPHRDTLVKLFQALREELPRVNSLGKDARDVFAGAKLAHQRPDGEHIWQLVKKGVDL